MSKAPQLVVAGYCWAVRHPLAWLREVHAEVRDLLQERDRARAADHSQRSRYDASRPILERMLRRNPSDQSAQWHLRTLAVRPQVARAHALQEEGLSEEAGQVLRELVDRHPEEPECHLELAAWVLTNDGDPETATRHARRAAELAWDDPNTVFRAAWFARHGSAAETKRLLARVDEIMASERPVGAAVFPFDTDRLHLDGLLAWDEGERDFALERFELAFARQPEDPEIGADLALAYVEYERSEDALEIITRGLEHHPTHKRLLRVRRIITDES